MQRNYAWPVCILVLLAAWPALARAVWPDRVFAPYAYLDAGADFDMVKCADACGQKFYTLAFIIADKQHHPAWDGGVPLDSRFYARQIAEIRRRGGDIIVSFGGAGGTELAVAEPDETALQAKYQAILERYKLTWLDFDIEESTLTKDDVNRRRNAVLARLQAKNPGLIISYTLPGDPDGITQHSQDLLADARSKGLKVHSANIMTMDFGPHHSTGKKMSAVCIATAAAAWKTCHAIDPAIRIGLTPMIGQNDVKTEYFRPADAAALETWAAGQPWVCSLSFWSSNRDASATASGVPQAAWDFSNTFKAFTAP